jgi:hypothetical protein
LFFFSPGKISWTSSDEWHAVHLHGTQRACQKQFRACSSAPKRPHKTLNQISTENKRRNPKSSACLQQCKQENKPNSQTTTHLSLHSPREKRVVVASERGRERRKDAGARGTTTQEEEASLLPVSFHALSFSLH